MSRVFDMSIACHLIGNVYILGHFEGEKIRVGEWVGIGGRVAWGSGDIQVNPLFLCGDSSEIVNCEGSSGAGRERRDL